MDLAPGVIVGDHYRLDSLLGVGGMGAVWLCTDLSLGRVVALKVLHADLRSDPHLNERFQREARLLASVDHPAIVPIYAWIVLEDGGRACPGIVMPFVKGESLADALRRRRCIPPSEAFPIVRQLLEALAAAHAAGIVHRDLKPQNVMLEARAGGTQVRLLDFGVAKSLAPSSGGGAATQVGMIIGTPDYMS
ncbi:MAG: serine/threonine-protein kinase, partial [Deltaproteobacteria bacterium]